jgi:hypothetical protein
MGDWQMRLLLACAIAVTAAVALGGCWWHHQEQVVVQPMEPLK